MQTISLDRALEYTVIQGWDELMPDRTEKEGLIQVYPGAHEERRKADRWMNLAFKHAIPSSLNRTSQREESDRDPYAKPHATTQEGT